MTSERRSSQTGGPESLVLVSLNLHARERIKFESGNLEMANTSNGSDSGDADDADTMEAEALLPDGDRQDGRKLVNGLQRQTGIDSSDMGRRYSSQSGSDGDVETDPNMDFGSQKSKMMKNRYSNITSSIESLDGDQTDQNTEETKTGSTLSQSLSQPPSQPHFNNNDVADSRLAPSEREAGGFNILAPSMTGHGTFFPAGHEPAPSSESSAGFSCEHNSSNIRDTDSDNNRQRTGVGDYHTGNMQRTLSSRRPMHTLESFAPTCHYCLDNQSQVLPHHHPATHSHQGSCCGSLPHSMSNQYAASHYHQNIPHLMSRSQHSSKYQSGSYEPPWDLVYPHISELELLQQHHIAMGGGHHLHHSMDPGSGQGQHIHNGMYGHSNAPTNITGQQQHQHSPYRASNAPVSRSASTQDRLGKQNNSVGLNHSLRQPNNGGTNTLATTTGSHSYETPWDLGDRHIPPPSSPPPPPPESLHRPMVHYDGAALAQANFVQHLPQKKPVRRRCNWRCISVFLILAIVILAGCVAAFTYLLVDKENSTNSPTSKESTGALSGPVTDGNIGDRHRSDVPPYAFVKVRFYLAKSQFYKFNVSLNTDAVIGIYGRRSIQPTHTQYDFIEAIVGERIASSLASGSRKRRSTDDTASSVKEVNTAFVRYLDEGYWYLSFYNDGPDTQGIRFTASRHDNMATDCPNDCYGKGDCKKGVCRCYPGYRGAECNLYACPVLCSGNGVYEDGICKCFDNWKGSECSIQFHHCEACEHGRCVDGECLCEDGWRGERCEEVDCPVSDCSGHGLCHSGRCYCEIGYRGTDCGIDEMKNFTIACSNDCSGHGTFDPQLQTCSCDSGWQGRNCEEKECVVECMHGRCSNGHCSCEDLWGGVMCHEKRCDSRCSLHGECNNGTCDCQPGWNGRHCTLNGCPSDCNTKGSCVRSDDVYSCLCNNGWKGTSCDIQSELICDDGLDNDGDNLADCLDPDCCSLEACSKNSEAVFCQTVPEPVSILLAKPKISAMASFYDSKKFLLEGDTSGEDSSTQRGMNLRIFNKKKVSVIHGTVLLRDGSPALGTRVEIDGQIEAGFTLTRQNGTFDIMVNGGGSVTVIFIRGSARPANATVILPWNTLVTLEPVTLLQAADAPFLEPTCNPYHDRYKLYPVVLPTWQHSQLRACPERSAIIPESQVAQESISLEGTNMYLQYKTSDTTGYRSTILIQLTPSVIPDSLYLVHLKVSVEGVIHKETFEADPSLTYRYSWQRQNAYQQNVYGIVNAHVSVGYQYADCEKVFWDKQATTLSGFLGGDLSSSDRSVAKGWSLDIQHFYNYQEGILHKGDGTSVYLREKPQTLQTVFGNGSRRETECTTCDGSLPDKPLLAPVAIASDLDGAVYVADYNVIRRLNPEMSTVTSVLELSGPSMSYRYHMTVSSTDGRLYLTDFQNKQVLRVKKTTPGELPVQIATNFEVIAGTGRTCVRGAGTKCGDGGDAKLASLTNPKGIAVSLTGEVYFVDDTTIRRIKTDGVIETVIGTQDFPGQYVAMPCGRAAHLYEVFLGWPTSIAFSPIDGTLHILDSSTNLVLQVTPENKVAIVAGRPTHCPEIIFKRAGLGLLGDDHLQSLRARNTDLVAVKSMTFAPNGNLYIIESDGEMVNRIRVVSTDGYISHYAGGKPPCNCQMPSCPCWDPEETIAVKALLNNPTALTVTPDGVLYIADMGNLRVHSVIPTLRTTRSRSFELSSTDDGQVYKFDRNGFHVHTMDIMTNTILYNFTMYPANSISGSLVAVYGRGGQVLRFNRNFEGMVENITLNGGLVGRVSINENRELHRYTSRDGTTFFYNYALGSGLLTNKQTSRGEVYLYDYDDAGRLTDVILPTGEQTQLDATVDSKGAKISFIQNAAVAGTATYNGNSLSLSHGIRSADVTYSNDGSIVVEYPSGLIVTLETGTTPTLSGESHTSLKRKIIASEDGPVHRLEWRYYIRRHPSLRLGKKIRVSRGSTPLSNAKTLMVNGRNLLSLEYIDAIRLEVIKDGTDQSLLQVLYNAVGQPIFLAGHVNTISLSSVNITYNTAGQMTFWKQGPYVEERVYNGRGQLEKVMIGSAVTTTYSYSTGIPYQPTGVILPTGLPYQLKYDTLGNLVQLVTPESQIHSFQSSMNLGFIRHGYTLGGKMYMEDYDASGHIIRRIYPSEYRYTADGRPSQILYDSNIIRYGYHPTTHALTNVHLTAASAQYECDLHYQSNGSLYDQHRISLKSKLGHIQFADCSFSYSYNKFLRVTNINGSLADGSRALSFSISFSYDESTGNLDSVSDFTITKTRDNKLPKTTIANNKIRLTRTYNSFNLLSDVQLNIGRQRVYQSSLRYDTMRRVSEWSTTIGLRSQKAYYVYNTDSNVIQVRRENKGSHYYKYNGQGSVSEVKVDSETYKVTNDIFERATNYRGLNYQYDQDGFLSGKGNIKYSFNSQGQLTHVLESGKLDVAYYYDAIGRLMMRRDNYGSTLQLIYSNVMRPSQITHVYNFTSRALTSILYDDLGHVLALEGASSGRQFVMCDHSGTPVLVYDDEGSLVKALEYTVFGEVVRDSDPSINTFLGFQGGFYDSVTELVYLSERWYDPLLGRWLDARLSGIFDRIKSITDNPTSINGYQYQWPLNLHLMDRQALYMKDLSSWLRALGYDLDVLAPKMTFEGRLSRRDEASSERALLPLVSAFQCAYEKDMDNFLELSVVPKSRFLDHSDFSDGEMERRWLTPTGSLFSQGIVLSVSSDNRLVTHLGSSSTPSQETLLATKVLNGSDVLRLNYTTGGKVIHYLLKPQLSSLDDDLKTLGIQTSANHYLLNGVRVRITRLDYHDPVTNAQLSQGDLIVSGNTTEFHVRYGSNREQETSRVLRLVADRAVQYAWLEELQTVNEGRRSTYLWTSAEINQLKRTGKVPGYGYSLLRSAQLYPELADDPSNVRFVKS